MSPWIQAARFKTLTATLTPILVSGALVFHLQHSVPIWTLTLILCSALSIQIATNFINDGLYWSSN